MSRTSAEMQVDQADQTSASPESGPWLPWSVRTAWLRRFRRAVAAHGREIAGVVSSEIGKSEGEAFVSEVMPLLAAIRWHERHARRVLRVGVASGRPAWLLGRSVRIGRMPLGHVLLIATWNYPVGLLGVQLVQAIAAGNRVTVKPSERSPASQRLLVSLASACGLPSGWIALADASAEAGRRLVEEGRFDKVLFTGGTRAGSEVAVAAAGRLLPSVLELSGHDSALVLSDADVRLAASRIWQAAIMNAGQTCMAPRRVLVDRACYRAFVSALSPLAAGARPVRLMCAAEADRCMQQVRGAVARGARSLSGVLEPAADGWLRPLAVVDCAADAPLVAGDHFGPALAVVPVSGLEEALRLHAASTHRLSVSVYTRSVRRLRGDPRFLARLGASVVTFNESVLPTAHPAVPIAGHGASGWGASRGEAGLLELSRPLTVCQTASWTPSPVPPEGAALRWLDGLVRWMNRGRRVARLMAPVVATLQSTGVQPSAAKKETCP